MKSVTYPAKSLFFFSNAKRARVPSWVLSLTQQIFENYRGDDNDPLKHSALEQRPGRTYRVLSSIHSASSKVRFYHGKY